MKVWIVGAGPGDPELVTVKGLRLIREADVVVYAGSLVNQALLSEARPGIPLHDSSRMTFEQVCGLYTLYEKTEGSIVRLHSGDPSMYGAIQEQIDFCRSRSIPVEVVPGVSSVFAAAAAVRRELTLPGISQTVVLTRVAGRTPVPEQQRLAALGSTGATLAIFLSTQLIRQVVNELLLPCGADTPVRVVSRASWPDQRILEGTLADIADTVRSAGIDSQAMILVGRALAARAPSYERSKLYDPSFAHGYRKAES